MPVDTRFNRLFFLLEVAAWTYVAEGSVNVGLGWCFLIFAALLI